MAYTPEPDSLAGRVCAFFRAKPTEELSTVEIAQQFGKPTSSIPALLASCVINNLLARRKDTQMNTLWFAGPKLFHEGAPTPCGVITPTPPKRTEPEAQAPAAAPTMPPAPQSRTEEFNAELLAPQPQVKQAAESGEVAVSAQPISQATTDSQLKGLQLDLQLATCATRALLHLLDRVDASLPDDQRATAAEYQLTRSFAKSALDSIEHSAAA